MSNALVNAGNGAATRTDVPLSAPLGGPILGRSLRAARGASVQVRGGFMVVEMRFLDIGGRGDGGMTPCLYCAIPPCRSSSHPATVSGFPDALILPFWKVGALAFPGVREHYVEGETPVDAVGECDTQAVALSPTYCFDAIDVQVLREEAV